MKPSATAQLEEIARDRVACGYAQTFDDGLIQAVDANPELYRQSMTEGVKAFGQMPKEIQAALAVLEPGERAEVEKLASRIYLVEGASTEADSLMLAIQRTPSVHLKCANADPVRAETRKMIDEMRNRLKEDGGAPHAKLRSIADGYRSNGMAGSDDEAWVMAVENNPQLFQAWQDSQPKPSDVKAAESTGFEGKARALVTAGEARDIDEAFELVAASDPKAYSEYLKTLG